MRAATGRTLARTRYADRMLGSSALGGLNLRLIVIALSIATVFPATAWAAAIPAIHSEAPPDALTADPIADLAADLDYDLEQIYRFVADKIQYEPYEGILRGVVGTLEAGAGNSSDQSLLLAALLDESLIPYRFARGALDETAAAEVAKGAIIDASEARAAAERILVGDVEATLRDVSAEPDEAARSQAVAASDAVDATIERAAAQLDGTVALIEEALIKAGVTLPGITATLPAAEVEAHTWLQASFGAEWLDLFPSLAGTATGEVPTVAAETLDALPDELRHDLEFEVFVERVQGDQLETESILQFSAPADRLAGVPMSFGHLKPSGLEQLGIAVRNLMGDGGLQYQAVFDINGQSIVGDEPVTFGIRDSEGGGGLFDDSGFFGDDDAPAEGAGPAQGEATAEWLEVRYTPPAGEPVTSRRTIFDRLPPDQRFGGEPGVESVAAVETIDLDGTGELDSAPMVRMHSFAVATSTTPGSTLVSRATAPDTSILTSMALAYHYLRDILAVEIGLDRNVRTFLDGPNVVSVSMGVDVEPEEPVLRLGVDIWHRSTGTMPVDGGATLASQPGVLTGVLAHVAERTAVQPPLDESGTVPPGHLGVGELFDTAARAGIPTVTIQDRVPAGAAYGPAAMALIGEALAAGDIVVAPAQPVTVGGHERVGWWRIDPDTGLTVDVMDDGTGTESTEYQLPLTMEFRVANCIFALTGTIFAVLVEVLDMGGFNDAKRGVSLVSILYQGLSAGRSWGGTCK